MSMNLGYLAATAIFLVIFVAVVMVQIAARQFRPGLYWLTIVATTTVGTTLADFADRSLGIGYAGGASLLFALLIASLALVSNAWLHLGQYRDDAPGRSVLLGNDHVLPDPGHGTRRLGRRSGGPWLPWQRHLVRRTAGGARVRLAAPFCTRLFWAAFVLTRPLGAVVGDFLDKPLNDGLAFSRYSAAGGARGCHADMCIRATPAGGARSGPLSAVALQTRVNWGGRATVMVRSDRSTIGEQRGECVRRVPVIAADVARERPAIAVLGHRPRFGGERRDGAMAVALSGR